MYYYCIIKQTGQNCEVTSNVSEVKVINAPTITTQPQSSTVCQNGTATVLSVVFANGTGIPTYEWFSTTNNTATAGISVATSSTFQPPTALVGTLNYYSVLTFSSGGCSQITSNIATVTVIQNAIIASQPTPEQKICAGGTIATPFSVTYTNGSGTATYQWFSNTTSSASGGTAIPSATAATFTPAAFSSAGIFYYYVTITLSGNGCAPITSNVAKVEVLPDPIISTQPTATQTLCQGATPINLSVAITGGEGTASYQWYSNTANNNTSGTVIAAATSSTYTPPTATVGTLYYYCIIKQTGQNCEVTSNVATINITAAPVITSQPQSSTVCQGVAATQLNVEYTNGTGIPTYEWFSTTNNTATGGISVGNLQTYQPQNIIVGTLNYYCIITLPPTGGCFGLTTNLATVIVNPVPVISNKSEIICSGNAFTTSPATSASDLAPTGTTYSWALPAFNPPTGITGASAGINQSSITQTLTNTTTNAITVVYNVIPKTGNCVGNSFTITVTVNPSISVNPTVVNSTCYLANNGSITTNATGGIPFSGSNPYIYSWTGPNGFSAVSPSISNLAIGDYSLTVQDQGGCPISVSYTITHPAAVAIVTDLVKNISCFGANNGEIQITPLGGTMPYRYSWRKNNIAFATSEDIVGLSAGTYTLTLSDTNSCGPATATYVISEPTLLAVNSVSKTNILCSGAQTGSVSVAAIGGTKIEITPGAFDYLYNWSGPNGFLSNLQNLSAVFAGSYVLTVTDKNGCVATLTTQITEPAAVSITVVKTEISCYGANDATITLNISGGVGPFNVSWSNFATGTYQNNLAANDYVITVKDANNCIKTITVNIPEAPIFAVFPVVKQISCFGNTDGSIALNFVGGQAPINFAWSDSPTAGTVRNNLPAGSYTITITDGKPCNITRTFTIIEPQKLVLTANLTNAFDCNDANSGKINLLVSGGTPPFIYSWSNGATTEDLNNISAGNYLITVTDARLCTVTAQYIINRQAPLLATVSTKSDFNCTTKVVIQTFEAVITGGIPPYQLSWSNGTVSGSNNQFMNTNQNGTVILGVTDSFGCFTNYTFNVAIPVLGSPGFDVTSFAFVTYGIHSILDPIQFTNNASGDYTSVSWNFGDGSVSSELNPTHTYAREGDYIVVQTVTYPFGCVYTFKTTLVVNKGYLIMMPSGFTPNDDKINDTFVPLFKGLKDIKLEVYDTWGEMIFSEQGVTLKGWDGRLNGKDAENGNYFFKILATTFYGTTVSENAPFTLIK